MRAAAQRGPGQRFGRLVIDAVVEFVAGKGVSNTGQMHGGIALPQQGLPVERPG